MAGDQLLIDTDNKYPFSDGRRILRSRLPDERVARATWALGETAALDGPAAPA